MENPPFGAYDPSLRGRLGKTRTASSIVKHWPGRVLWCAHRDFLCSQARVELGKLTGEYVDLEKAGWYSGDSRIVVGSVQTLKGDRLAKFDEKPPTLIVFDEGHHGTSKSWRSIADRFQSAKILYITATPKRADKTGLWNIADAAVEPFGIDAGLSWGSFVPFVPIGEFIDSIDLSRIHSQNGDLALGELEKEVAKSAAPIAQITVKHCTGLQTIVYTPGVASAHAVAACLREMGFTAASVDADTPWEVRKKVLDDFKAQAVQYIVNCGIYTEGLDVPGARAIVIARPTKSESLYIQMAGRGGRPEGWIGNLDTAKERLDAIRYSGKPNFKLIDVTGHAGRHSLASSGDLLGGSRIKDDSANDDEFAQKAKNLVKEEIAKGNPDGKTFDELLDEATKTLREQEEESRKKIAKAAAAAEVRSRQASFDPLIAKDFDDRHHGEEPFNPSAPATADEVKWLKDNRLPFKNVSREMVRSYKEQASRWRRDGMASFAQRNCLRRNGITQEVTFAEAKALIVYMKQNGRWRPDSMTVERVLREVRNPQNEESW